MGKIFLQKKFRPNMEKTLAAASPIFMLPLVAADVAFAVVNNS
jgi:hypothetical protein